MKGGKGISAGFWSRYNKKEHPEGKKDIAAKHDFIIRADKRYLRENAENMLDVGYGYGSLFSPLGKRYELSGLEIDKNNVSKARASYPNVRVFKGDMRTFSINDKYDIITSICAIDHGTKLRRDLGKTIKNMGRHLKPHGIIIFDMPLAQETCPKDSIYTYSGKIVGEKGTKYTFIYHKQLEDNGKLAYSYSLAIKSKGRSSEYEIGKVYRMEELLSIPDVKSIASRNGFKCFVYDGWRAKAPAKGKLTNEPVFVLAR